MGQIQINRIHLVPLLWPHLYLFACFSFLNISITIVHLVMHVNHVCHRLKPFPSAGQPFTLCSSSSAADWRWLMGEFGLWSPLKPAHPFGCYCIVFEHFWTILEGTVRLLVSEDISRCWKTFQGLLFDSSWLSQCFYVPFKSFCHDQMDKSFWGLECLFPVSCPAVPRGVLWQGEHVTAGAISSEIPFSSVLICNFLLFGCHPNAHFPSPPSDSWQCPMFLGFPAKLLVSALFLLTGSVFQNFLPGHLEKGGCWGSNSATVKGWEKTTTGCKFCSFSAFCWLWWAEEGDQHKQNVFRHPYS